jgi:aminopeptidase YwaD
MQCHLHHKLEYNSRILKGVLLRKTTIARLLQVSFTVVVLATFSLLEAESVGKFVQHLRYLASDELKGRGNNRPEIQMAADYIADCFRDYGLRPAGADGSYFQEFEVSIGIALQGENRVVFQIDKETSELKPGEDYVPLTIGGAGSVRGSLIFAGFGITAPELLYDDYEGLDVDGKVVLVYQHQPHQGHRFGRELTPYASLSHKILNARERGAVGVIIVPDPLCEQERSLERELHVDQLGIHAVRATEAWGKWLLKKGRSAGTGGTPGGSRALPEIEVTLSINVVNERYRLRNVVGLVPGAEEEVIILGAHYDHLGLGDKHSLSPEQIGQIHYGADDNASGTAGLLQIAESFAKQPRRYGVLFIAFAGEELGLLGSFHYTENPVMPLHQTRAMLNLDMIGRSQGELIISGVGTALEFRPILERLQADTDLTFRFSETPGASSDHLSFARRRIPVLFFFCGLHADYHKPSDVWQSINVEGSQEVVKVVRGVFDALEEQEGALQSVDLARETDTAGGAETGPSRALGATFDLGWGLDGVRVERIHGDKPAALAGLQAGDIIVEAAGRRILSIHDLGFALQVENLGGPIRLAIVREGAMLWVDLFSRQDGSHPR